jgi:hypothetical protein
MWIAGLGIDDSAYGGPTLGPSEVFSACSDTIMWGLVWIKADHNAYLRAVGEQLYCVPPS